MPKRRLGRDVKGQGFFAFVEQKPKKPVDSVIKRYRSFWDRKYKIARLFDALKKERQFCKTKPGGRLPYQKWREYNQSARRIIGIRSQLRSLKIANSEIEKPLRDRKPRETKVDAEVLAGIMAFEKGATKRQLFVERLRTLRISDLDILVEIRRMELEERRKN